MLSYPSGMTVSTRALNLLADTLRRHRNQRGNEVCEVLTFGADGLVVSGGGTYAGSSGTPAGAR